MVAPLLLLAALAQGDARPSEADYYRILTYDPPEGVVLEVSGLAVLPDGRPLLATRRGEVWLADEAYGDDPREARFTKIVEGLQEPLGLLVHEGGWIYVVQRGELSRMRDVDGDDLIDEIETVCDTWRVGGNYHEYNFGPRLDQSGDLWVTTNRPFGDQPFGQQPWRGFALRITPDGTMVPECSGLRSPAGVEVSPWGDVFYTDNQGEWCGASKLSRLEPGSFHGHPLGLFSCELEGWRYPHPGEPPNGKTMPDVALDMPAFRLPAVWFPYGKMGQSPAGFAWDTTGGRFGPFGEQVFVTDQHHASLMRVFLEQVNGTWQGACFPFRNGFQCGTLRVAWAPDGSLLVGETNRGWGSLGTTTEGFQRLVWTGATPFEVHEMVALPDGFELRFTAPVDPATAGDPASYRCQSWTYLLHATYGSDPTDVMDVEVVSASVSDDRTSVRLRLDHLRAGYLHELIADGVRAADGTPLLHPEAYYTLVEVPERTEYMGREIARTMHWSGGPWLLRNSREEEENTELLLDNLGLRPGMAVADLGCGNGYLSLPIAQRILPEGVVRCVELQPEYFPQLESRAAEVGVSNYDLVRATSTSPRLAPDSCDLVLMVDVYHELAHPELVLTNLARALREDGRLALVEFRAEDPEVPIKPLHKMSRSQATRELEANGWTLAGSYDGLPWQHLLFFAPPENGVEQD